MNKKPYIVESIHVIPLQTIKTHPAMATATAPITGAAVVDTPFIGPFRGGGILLGPKRLLEVVELRVGSSI